MGGFDWGEVLTTSRDGSLALWSGTTGAKDAELTYGGEVLAAQSFHGADFSRIATAWSASGRSSYVEVRALTEHDPLALFIEEVEGGTPKADAFGSPVGVPLHHPGRIESVRFRPDGAALLTIASGHARLWNAPKRSAVSEAQRAADPPTEAHLLPHRGAVNSALFVEAGSRILTLAEDGTLRRWRGASGEGSPFLTLAEPRGCRALSEVPAERRARLAEALAKLAECLGGRRVDFPDIEAVWQQKLRLHRERPLDLDQAIAAADPGAQPAPARDRVSVLLSDTLDEMVGAVLALQPRLAEEGESAGALDLCLAAIEDAECWIELAPGQSWPIERLAVLEEQAGVRMLELGREEEGRARVRRAAGILEAIAARLRPHPARHADLVSALGSLSWYWLFVAEGQKAIDAARAALALDPTKIWIETNLAHGLLLVGDREAAAAIYVGRADVLVDVGSGPVSFREAVLKDFEALRRARVVLPGMEEIEALLRDSAKKAGGG
ncbi:MAG: hypothetical protein ACT4PV_11075 [Planctomycetaceae bacterium]